MEAVAYITLWLIITEELFPKWETESLEGQREK